MKRLRRSAEVYEVCFFFGVKEANSILNHHYNTQNVVTSRHIVCFFCESEHVRSREVRVQNRYHVTEREQVTPLSEEHTVLCRYILQRMQAIMGLNIPPRTASCSSQLKTSMFSRRITSNKATTKQLAELLGAVDHWELGDCQSITIHNHYSMKYNPLELGLTVGDKENRESPSTLNCLSPLFSQPQCATA